MTEALRVDATDPTPPYEQLRRQLVALIAAGSLPEGARLPPVRQLAADLALATGTVARTYRELEAEGLVQSRRSAGTRVTGRPAGLPAPRRHEQVVRLLADAVRQARLLGAGDAEIRDALALALPEVDDVGREPAPRR
jgi:DNA-binding transcriptional regulator YhcF (GntR family)